MVLTAKPKKCFDIWGDFENGHCKNRFKPLVIFYDKSITFMMQIFEFCHKTTFFGYSGAHEINYTLGHPFGVSFKKYFKNSFHRQSAIVLHFMYVSVVVIDFVTCR